MHFKLSNRYFTLTKNNTEEADNFHFRRNDFKILKTIKTRHTHKIYIKLYSNQLNCLRRRRRVKLENQCVCVVRADAAHAPSTPINVPTRNDDAKAPAAIKLAGRGTAQQQQQAPMVPKGIWWWKP